MKAGKPAMIGDHRVLYDSFITGVTWQVLSVAAGV